MKLLNLAHRKHFIFVMLIVLSFVLVHIVQVVTAADSSQDLTVASQEYVDAKISELNAKIEQLGKQSNQQSSSGSSLFEVVELKAGQSLIAGASAEIIVRSGTATIIGGKNNDGLADITTDDSKKNNLITGQVAPLNHLLLVSRDDGRGIKAISSKVYLLFKGTYTIK